MPNMFIILIMLIGLFMKKKLGFAFGIIFGLLIDFFIGEKIGINAISLALTGLVAEILDKNISKDNRITVMFLTSILTLLSEVIVYGLKILFCGANVQIVEFIRIVVIEIIFNSILIAIIYPGFLAFGEKLERDFAKNTFLKF